jgi:hypothetical protein
VRFVSDAKVLYRQGGSNRLSYVGHSNKKLEAHFLRLQLQMEVLLSLENSERVRAACLKRLQACLKLFYPGRPDIVKQAEQRARSLGGKLDIPRLGWKYSWPRPIFGCKLAKRIQFWLPTIRWSAARSWDKALFYLERPNLFPSIGRGVKSAFEALIHSNER